MSDIIIARSSSRPNVAITCWRTWSPMRRLSDDLQINPPARLLLAEVHCSPTGIFDFSEQLHLDVQYRLMAEISGAHCALELYAGNEVIFASFDTDNDPDLLNRRRAGVYRALVQLPRELLKPGRYFINVTFGIPQGEIIDQVVRVVEFEIGFRNEYSATISYAPHRRGVVACNIYWETAHLPRRWQL